MIKVLLYLIGIYIFSSGFLLSRLNLVQKSTRITGLNVKNQKAIIIILDALRFDFTHSSNNSNLYLNNLKILENLKENSASNALLLRSRSDPPTTTAQRLEAMLTGSLPTFIDLSSNFGDNKISEDNLIYQLVQQKKKIHFMGDDTWLNLFPSEYFYKAHPFPSFEVWDLHSVDNGITRILFDQIKKDDWDVIVAHFLGVDHVGHKFGPNHIAMKEKLLQVDKWLTKVFETIDNDTYVFVLGDHGMDEKGDHGGDGPLEVDTTTFVYSKKQIVNTDKDLNLFWDLVKKRADSNFNKNLGYFVSEGFRTISQIDIVPTISMLMGTPIPFGNLGSVIPELFLFNNDSNSLPLSDLIRATRENSIQIYTYLKEYSSHSRELDFKKLNGLFEVTEDSFQKLLKFNKNLDAKSLQKSQLREYLEYCSKVYLDNIIFQRHSLLNARQVWAKFNMTSIWLVPASDSFTYWEDWVVFYLLQTFGFVTMLYQLREKKNIDYTVFFLLLTRLSNYSTICRTEQGPSCVPTFNSSAMTSVASIKSLPILVGVQFVVFLSFYKFSKDLFRQKKNYQYDFVYLISGFFSLASICLLKILETLENNNIVGDAVGEIKLTLTRYFILPVIVLTLAFWFNSNFRHRNTHPGDNGSLPQPYLTSDESSNLMEEWEPKNKTVISSENNLPSKLKECEASFLYLNFFTLFVYVPLLLTQKPMGGIILGMGYLRILCVVKMNFGRDIPVLMGIVFHLIGLHTFFTTGHQTTFSSIQMEVGFIGLRKVNWYITPLLIFLNTFSGYILSTFGQFLFFSLKSNTVLNLKSFVFFEGLTTARTPAPNE
ncbi:mannose-ethanolamine phosphotransferase gpi13 [Lobulomyces angularis]|nr:mannose-ethanolamine phosphotransferase gpi13 [Lobulomyces angularis]